MSKKQLTISLIALLVMSALIYYMKSSNNSSTLKKEISNFAVSDTAMVTKIFMADRMGKKVLLERVNSSEWRLNGKYKAKSSTMNTLLETMHDITVKETVPKTAFNTIVKRLAAEAVKVEIYQGESLTKTYYVGGPTLDFYGTYMMMENSSKPFITWIHGFEGYLTTRYFVEENLWRSNYIFPTSPLDLACVHIEYPKNPDLSFELNITHNASDNEKLSFSLKSIKTGKQINIDENAVKAYLLEFKGISFEDVGNIMKPKLRDSTLSLPPLHIIKVKDTKNQWTTLTTYPRKGQEGKLDQNGNQLVYDLDRFYAKMNDEKDLLLVQYYVFDKILKPITYFER